MYVADKQNNSIKAHTCVYSFSLTSRWQCGHTLRKTRENSIAPKLPNTRAVLFCLWVTTNLKYLLTPQEEGSDSYFNGCYVNSFNGLPTYFFFMGLRWGVEGRPELMPWYWYLAFFSDGFNIYNNTVYILV